MANGGGSSAIDVTPTNEKNESGQKSTQLSAKLIQLAYSPDMIEQKEREFEFLVLWVTNID
jgi:hypothetical protein